MSYTLSVFLKICNFQVILLKLTYRCVSDLFYYIKNRNNKIDPSQVHLLGHSLGSHISGIIGNYFNGTIGRITGLDPAGPLFENFVSDGLLPTHAKFVDCIHTDSPILGQLLQRGHVDYYPNNGKVFQPGCEFLDVLTATACSHYRAPLYFAESIQLPKNFASFSCSLQNIINGQCNPSKAESVVFMGENTLRSAKGTYFLRTNKISPFGRGMSSFLYSKFINISTSSEKPTVAITSSTQKVIDQTTIETEKSTTTTMTQIETKVTEPPILSAAETTTENSIKENTESPAVIEEPVTELVPEESSYNKDVENE